MKIIILPKTKVIWKINELRGERERGDEKEAERKNHEGKGKCRKKKHQVENWIFQQIKFSNKNEKKKFPKNADESANKQFITSKEEEEEEGNVL